jgi:hypothetical protein
MNTRAKSIDADATIFKTAFIFLSIPGRRHVGYGNPAKTTQCPIAAGFEERRTDGDTPSVRFLRASEQAGGNTCTRCVSIVRGMKIETLYGTRRNLDPYNLPL